MGRKGIKKIKKISIFVFTPLRKCDEFSAFYPAFTVIARRPFGRRGNLP